MSATISIHGLYLSSGHDFKGRFGMSRLDNGTEVVESVECVEGRGLIGDRYFDFKDNYKGQLSLIAKEAIASIESDLDKKIDDWTVFRRNVVTGGLDLNDLIGRTFELGDVVLEGSEACKPCFWMDEALGPGAFDAMENRGGLRCRILRTGTLHLGLTHFRII